MQSSGSWLGGIVGKIRRSLKRRGLRGTAKLSVLNVYWFFRDMSPERRRRRRLEEGFVSEFQVDTYKGIFPEDFDVDGASLASLQYANHYEPTPVSWGLNGLLRSLRSDYH